MAARHTSYEPLPRSEHAAVAVDNKLHMWGGFTESKEKSREVAQKLEVFDISTEQWEQKPTHGTPPPGLSNTAYAVVGSCLFVFGGLDGDESRHNSLFKLDLHTYQWEQVRVSNPSSGPQRKNGCGMVSYGDNQLVVFAGYTGNVLTYTFSEWTDELHVFDLNKGEWSSPAVTGTKPPPLSLFSFNKVDSRRAVVYGGYMEYFQSSGDVYVLELDKWNWTKMDTTGGPRPRARESHTACCIAGPLTGQEHPLLLVGGGFGGGTLKDMWLLDVDRGVWSEVTLPQEMGRRVQYTATVFGSGPNFRMVVMFGGRREFQGDPIAVTTLLHLEWHGGELKLTKVVRERELGRPAERLKEQMEKLLLTEVEEEEKELVEQLKEEMEVLPAAQLKEEEELVEELKEQMEVLPAVQLKEEEKELVEELKEEMEVLPAAQLKEEEKELVEELKEQMEVLPAAQLKEEEMAKINYSDLEFVETVGSGGFGEVWKGRWKSKDKTVAIKKFKFGEMEREVTLLATLDHPHVIQFYGMVTEQPIIVGECIVTEFAENGSIYDYIHKKHNEPTLKQSVLWAKEVTEGMIYFHQRDIIHRDLKSRNVVLTSTLTAKICDLGSARILEHTQLQTTAVGTYAWMAPEMLRREPVSKACDVYSFGILLWEILVRKEPFSDITPIFLPSKIVEGERPPIPETCDSHLGKLMTHCWQDDPKARPRFTEILKILEHKY